MTKLKWREYAAAEEYVRSLGLKNSTEWVAFCASGRKPLDTPKDPRRAYGEQVRGWRTFLGTESPDE